MGIGGDDGRSGIVEAEDAKTEMMKMREIVALPGGMVEMILDLAC